MNDPLPNTTCPACGGPNGCVPARTGSFGPPCATAKRAEPRVGPLNRATTASRHAVARLDTGCGPFGPRPSRSFDARCWCADVSIDKVALERLSDADRGRACLCAACAGVTARAMSEPGGER